MLLLHNGTIHGEENYEWLLIENGRIARMGNGALPKSGKYLDLKGGHVFSSFCDAHTHLSNIALMQNYLDLTGRGKEEILDMVRKECGKKEIVLGRGWDESFWREKHYITSQEIDEVCQKPTILIREDGHLAVLNTPAMKKFDIHTPEGIVTESLLEKVLHALKPYLKMNLESAMKYALSKGITCVHDFANEETLKEYMRLHSMGRLKIRIFASFYRSTYTNVRKLGLYTGYGDEYLRIGALKLFADGSIGAKTAATIYVDGETVKPMLTARKLRRIVEMANSSGVKVFTHAIGDFAIEQVLRAYKGTCGNRIEHFELVRDEFLNELEKMKCIKLSMQPNFLKWALPGGLYEEKLGREWLSRNNPYAKIVIRGIPLLFGSDCMPMNPLLGIHLAVNSAYESQRIGVMDALKAYTEGSRYMSPLLGELKKGYLADLVVLGDDPLEKKSRIKDIQIKTTMIEGTPAYISELYQEAIGI